MAVQTHLLCIFSLVLYLHLILAAKLPEIEDVYYWRDYKGKIPSDALSAGEDAHGKPIYITQVLYKDLIIPGKLVSGDTESYFEYGNQELSSINNIKILCTLHSDLLEWIPATTKHFKQKQYFITGGYERDRKIYIGRGTYKNEVVVGKVVYGKNTPIWLHTTRKHKVYRLTRFQVLSLKHHSKHFSDSADVFDYNTNSAERN